MRVSAESEEGMAKKEACGKGKCSPPKKSADTITIRCGNDECHLRGECVRFVSGVEVKFAARKRKCEHFLKK